MAEELRHNKNGVMVTLTFSNESIRELHKDCKYKLKIKPFKKWPYKFHVKQYKKPVKEEFNLQGYALDNAIATLAVRRFNERWRKTENKALRHWLVTELGHNGTENIHLHGIVWTDKREIIASKWKYGYVFLGNFVNERTVNYIVKYVSKLDLKHKTYKSITLSSPGIGKAYTDRHESRKNKYIEGNTDETYRMRNGGKVGLPIYYRNKIYSEEERERLWLEKLDKEERYVDKTKVDVSTKEGMIEYFNLVRHAREKNNKLGYGCEMRDWNREKYENEIRRIKIMTRINRTEK